MESPNTSFSRKRPNLQLAIDSTSLGEFKTCPRRYQLSIIEGRVPRMESVHLIFGLLLHRGVELFYHYRSVMSFEDAQAEAVHQTMLATWDSTLARPWISDDKHKNRFTLIRTLVWYLDRWRDDPLETIRLQNGQPGVELSFSFDSGYSSQDGEPFILCGHLDRIALLSGSLWICDIKSTKSTINQDYFDKFTPDNQFTLYALAGRVAFQLETNGVICDATQVLVNESRFERGLVRRNTYQLDSWYRDLAHHLRSLEDCAREGYWPQNDKACNLYGGCPYRAVCSAQSAASAEQLLRSTFKHRTWDPLLRRGDI